MENISIPAIRLDLLALVWTGKRFTNAVVAIATLCPLFPGFLLLLHNVAIDWMEQR